MNSSKTAVELEALLALVLLPGRNNIEAVEVPNPSDCRTL